MTRAQGPRGAESGTRRAVRTSVRPAPAAARGRTGASSSARDKKRGGRRPGRTKRTVMMPAQLMAEADRARASAYAPYSGFAVGAALLTRGGKVVHGCNVENASFGLSMCAERNAIAKAIGEGLDHFEAIAVSSGPGKGLTPCGSCRQVLHEFAPHIWVLWRNGHGGVTRRRLESLLAEPFGPRRLGRSTRS